MPWCNQEHRMKTYISKQQRLRHLKSWVCLQLWCSWAQPPLIRVSQNQLLNLCHLLCGGHHHWLRVDTLNFLSQMGWWIKTWGVCTLIGSSELDLGMWRWRNMNTETLWKYLQCYWKGEFSAYFFRIVSFDPSASIRPMCWVVAKSVPLNISILPICLKRYMVKRF